MILRTSVAFSILILLIVGCDKNQGDVKLPIYGNKIFEETDTIYHTIADFQLVDQDSSWVTNKTFENQIYVSDFFFTTCPTICPIMKKQMLRVYEAYETNDQVAILSHTIDPKHDSVAVLKDFADKLGINSSKWKFVTGDMDYIYDLGETSYMVVADEDPDAAGGYIHSGAFLLVDKERRIRGVYDGTVEEQVDVLMNDIGKLLKEYEPAK